MSDNGRTQSRTEPPHLAFSTRRADERIRGVLSTAPRPRRPSAVGSSLTFCWRALLKIKHVPEQMFDVTLFPVMFTLLFTYLFGGALAGSTAAYLQYLLPGILVQSVVFITVYTGFGLNTDITKGVFDRIRSLPVWRPSVIVGALLGDTIRYSIASIVTIALGLVLGYRPPGGAAGVVLAVAILLAFSFCLSWVWTALGLVLRTPNSVMGVSMMLLFPLTFLSNIFVDPATMPSWLHAFVSVNPITLLVTAVRGLMDGAASTGDVVRAAAAGAAFVVVFGPLTMFIYARKK
jgi:ABC-2 type transport system permease protein